MLINGEELLARRDVDTPLSYADRDVILYALAVGMGRDPVADKELAYVLESRDLRVVPSFASVLGHSNLLDDCGWDYRQVLHADERLRLHRPLADADDLLLDSRVSGVRDLGPQRGLYVELQLDGRSRANGRPVFTLTRTLLARGDGGTGSPRKRLSTPHSLPDREPDLDCSLRTRGDQALLYRLLGDRNPLHADPQLARDLGFERPILHGLCTWGIACRAILRTICEYDPTFIRELQGRFTAPVYPGETLRTEMWQSANIVSFRVRAVERDLVVLDKGFCELAT